MLCFESLQIERKKKGINDVQSSLYFTPHKLETTAAAMEEAAQIWKKHGCPEVSGWQLSGSAIGQMSFTVAFDSASDFGICFDKVSDDPDFQAWRVKYYGTSDWVANTHARLYKKW